MKNISKRKNVMWGMVFTILISAFAILFYQTFPARIEKYLPDVTPTSAEVRDDQPSDLIDTPTPTIHVPGPFPLIEPVPRVQFDVSGWTVYENTTIGIRFRYPPEWGTPEEKFLLPCTQDQPEGTKCAFRGYDFKLTFPGSLFRVGGTRDEFTAGREIGLGDFGGLKMSNWDDLCTKYPRDIGYYVVHCQVSSPVVHFTAIGTSVFTSTSRVMLIDTPTHSLSGIAFYGGFLSKKYNDLVAERKDYYFNTGNTIILDPIRQAILERRLDEESMRNFDLFEKVFETVEIF